MIEFTNIAQAQHTHTTHSAHTIQKPYRQHNHTIDTSHIHAKQSNYTTQTHYSPHTRQSPTLHTQTLHKQRLHTNALYILTLTKINTFTHYIFNLQYTHKRSTQQTRIAF